MTQIIVREHRQKPKQKKKGAQSTQYIRKEHIRESCIRESKEKLAPIK